MSETDEDDIPDALIAIVKGMENSRIMEKLALTEEIIEVTDLSVEEAFAKANAAMNAARRRGCGRRGGRGRVVQAWLPLLVA